MTLVEDFFGSKSVFLDRFVSFRRILFVFFQVFGSYMMCMNMYYVIFVISLYFLFFFLIALHSVSSTFLDVLFVY